MVETRNFTRQIQNSFNFFTLYNSYQIKFKTVPHSKLFSEYNTIRCRSIKQIKSTY